jgi:hypothetical protein
MSPDIIEEWYHVKTGKESPVHARGFKTPEAYLIHVFGDAKFLPELIEYEQAVKFKKPPSSRKWIDVTSGALRVVGGVVLKFIPWVGWILLGAAEFIKLFAK